MIGSWIINHWQQFIENAGIIGGLFFTGLAVFIDARVRKAQTVLDVTREYRELWAHLRERSDLDELFNPKRDMAALSLTKEEVHDVNLLLNHLNATCYARSAGIFIQLDGLGDDIRQFLSYPATREAWSILRQAHDKKFVAYVDGYLPKR